MTFGLSCRLFQHDQLVSSSVQYRNFTPVSIDALFRSLDSVNTDMQNSWERAYPGQS